MVTWAVKPASDPASPLTQVVATTTHDMPLKLAQLARPPLLPGPLIFVPTNLRSLSKPVMCHVFLSLQVVARAVKPASGSASPSTQVVTTTTHDMPLRMGEHAMGFFWGMLWDL